MDTKITHNNMQDNFLNREKTQAILDSRPKGVDIPTALKELSNQGFTIEGYNDKPVQSAVSNVGGAVKSLIGGIGEGVGGIALSGIQKGGEYLVNKYGTEQMKQNVAAAPTLRQQYQQQMGKQENPSLYGAGQLGGEVMSLAAPVGAVGRLAKTGVEALGAGSKVAKLTQAGTEGAAFTAGQGLQSGEKQSLTDYAINTGLNIAVPGAGMVAKGLGENVAPRIINSLIKPLAKDFAYGKNPGKAVAELVTPANDFEGLISNISSTLDGVGSRIGSVVNQSQNLKQIDLSYTLKAIDEAINNANKTPRTNASLISRLEGVKSDLVDNIQSGIDPQSYKKLIGDLTKWTGNASDDQAVNKALKQTYGSTRQVMDDVLSKELSPEQFAQYKADSEAYGNLLSAKNAAEYRDKINERQNLISFGAKNAGLLTGVMTAVSTGGAGVPAILAGLAGAGIDKALATPAFKTRLASLLSKLAPKDVSTFFDTVPTAKSLFTEQQIKDFTGELKKNTKLNRGMVNPSELLPKKTNALLEEAKKYKSAEEFVKAQGIVPKDVNIRLVEGDNIVGLNFIETKQKGTGLGSKTMNVLKDYADAKGKTLVIGDITNQSFYDKFDYLKKPTGLDTVRIYSPADDVLGGIEKRISVIEKNIGKPLERAGRTTSTYNPKTGEIVDTNFGKQLNELETLQKAKSDFIQGKISSSQLTDIWNKANKGNATINKNNPINPKPNTIKKKFNYERAKDLSPENRLIEDKAFAKIDADEEGILSAYKKKFGNEVNTDNFRPLFKDEGYNGANAAAVQEPSSHLAKKAYTDALKNKGEYATFSAGGSGAGKSSGIKAISELSELKNKSAVILDSNLSSYSSAIEKIKEAQKAGKKFEGIYTYRDPVDSLINGVIKRMKDNPEEMGRIVPTKIIADNHIKSLETVKKLIGEGYNFRIVDNSLGQGKAKLTTLQDIESKAKYPSVEELTDILNKKVKELYEKGKLTAEQYREYVK
jgi:predicted ABC-type ATPase